MQKVYATPRKADYQIGSSGGFGNQELCSPFCSTLGVRNEQDGTRFNRGWRMIAFRRISDLSLAPQTQQADSEWTSRDSLVMENLSVVGMVVRRLARKLPPSVEIDDVQSAGILGLMDAAQKFDPSRGARFRTYAELRVQGAILDYLRSLSWAPRGMHRRAKEIDAARSIVEQRKNGTATVTELAEELDLTLEQCHQQLMQVDTLNFCETEDMIREVDQIRQSPTSSDACDPLLQLEGKAILGVVWEAIDTLPERHKLVLWLYYYEELTMKEVGAVLSVNEARVSQIHSKAITGLRQKVNQRLNSQAVNPA